MIRKGCLINSANGSRFAVWWENLRRIAITWQLNVCPSFLLRVVSLCCVVQFVTDETSSEPKSAQGKSFPSEIKPLSAVVTFA